MAKDTDVLVKVHCKNAGGASFSVSNWNAHHHKKSNDPIKWTLHSDPVGGGAAVTMYIYGKEGGPWPYKEATLVADDGQSVTGTLKAGWQDDPNTAIPYTIELEFKPDDVAQPTHRSAWIDPDLVIDGL